MTLRPIFLLFISNLFMTDSFFMYNTFFSLYKKLLIKQEKGPYKIKTKPLPNKLIISTPGGLHGFYLLGVTSFIKAHYDLSDYKYSGASAGAWNSLFLSFKGNDTEFIDNLLRSNIHNVSSVLELEQNMKSMLLDNYIQEQFDLDKLNVGVAVMKRFLKFDLVIYNDFITLEDAVDSCIASSHIPFITGGLLHRYRNKYCFDGGFFKYPYLNTTHPTLKISPSMWNSSYTVGGFANGQFGETRLGLNLTELYIQGYNDTKNNRHVLDELFHCIV